MQRFNPLTRPTVLVIDADAGVRDVLSDVLHDEDCYVVQAESSGRALKMLRSFRPDLILVDIGLGFCLSAMSELRIPLAVLSAFPISIEQQQEEVLPRVLMKPFDLPNLLGLLDVVAAIRDGRALVA